ncbi:MAG: hydrogenase maturation nickel metallochaperone HypA [Verrucomicrobiae bacterium]|nr:hydrogenase maturation nickel metallochaperone HypA [Verrucomicrobiae bacterium]MDW8308636.1 hydrogenase maturation nickel metallochaperone HypA [Verrucomicrobiales bacterium]
MHEMALMSEALRLAEESARAAGAARITALRLRIGALSSVVPEAMQFAWDVARRGTLAETAILQIEPVPAAAQCARCESEYPCDDFWTPCPRCGAVGGELVRGQELEIAAVEIEPAATPNQPCVRNADAV